MINYNKPQKGTPNIFGIERMGSVDRSGRLNKWTEVKLGKFGSIRISKARKGTGGGKSW